VRQRALASVAKGNGTKLVFDQVGFPEEEYDMLDSGWGEMSWEPMKKFLA
jgi:hypothetical protein